MVTPHADEWNTFMYTINELSQLAVEHRENEMETVYRPSNTAQIPVLH